MELQTSNSNSIDSMEKDYLIELVNRLQGEVDRLTAALSDDEVSVIPNDEQICLEQISFLKKMSLIRELTTEETKKFEIYAKTLKFLRNDTVKGKKKKPKIEDYSIEKLEKLASEGV